MSFYVKKWGLGHRSGWRVSAVALVAVCAVGLSACGVGGSSDGGGGGDEGPIKIALLAAETGPLAQSTYAKAANLRVKEINAAGGVNGRDLKLTVYDIGADPQTAINAANKLVGDHNVIVIGGAVTTLVNAVQPILDRADIPLLYQANTAALSRDVSGYKKIFSLGATTQAQQAAPVNFAKNKLGAGSVAVIGTNDEGSQTAARFGKEAAKEAGLTLQSDQAVAPTVTDVTPQILKIKAADVILEIGVPAVDTIVIRNARQNGVDVPILTTAGGAAQVTYKLTPADQLKDVYVTAVCATDVPLENQVDGAAKTYLKAFADEYGADVKQGTLAGTNYDGVSLAALALEAVGSSDKAKLIEYFDSSVKLEGVCGSYESQPEIGVLASPKNAFIMSAEGGHLKRAE